LPLVPCLTGEMNQVFLNMIVNATHAIADVHSDGDGAIKISTAQQGDDAEIRISDNGTGIPAKIRDKIFDPFFTTKEVGKGTGQGLSVCHDVVANKHGGSIRVESTEGEGSTFIIRLPLTEAKETPEAA
jgi:two-component system NtrC family sensor kinase